MVWLWKLLKFLAMTKVTTNVEDDSNKKKLVLVLVLGERSEKCFSNSNSRAKNHVWGKVLNI